MIAPSSYGALSATSANTIQGSRPGFTGQSGAKKLGFVVNGTTYSESLNNINPTDIKEFNALLKLSDFTVTSLTASDFSPTADYADVDGDEPHPTAAFSMSPRTFVWKDRTGATISNYNQTLGCGSGLNLPLKLRITLPNVKVKSRYGNPSESISTELVQEYKIGTTTGICFAKPYQMIVKPSETWASIGSWNWNNGSSTPHPTKGGGYTSDFDPVNGFKASASTKFPTTGFPKASFTLIMTSNASDWIFSSNNSAVTVDTGGKVTLNSKPNGAVTIKAIYKNDTNQVHYYTFDPRTVWVVPKLNPSHRQGIYTYADAKTACGGASGIASIAMLTNAPNNGAENYFTRAIGSVFGEWGQTTRETYPASLWNDTAQVDNYYWVSDNPPPSGYPYGVNSRDGKVIISAVVGSNVFGYLACRG
ncbi:hypothetical protein RCS94_09885 [Orbaceae bacterium ac157xtp]